VLVSVHWGHGAILLGITDYTNAIKNIAAVAIFKRATAVCRFKSMFNRRFGNSFL
jgi:hypothetical protein